VLAADLARRQRPPGWQAYRRHDVAPDQLAAELTAGATAAADHPGSLTPAAALDALEHSVSTARYWQEPDDVDRALANPDVTSAMVPLATVLAASPATAWWAAGMDAADQHTVVFDAMPAPPSAAAGASLARWQAKTLADEQQAAERPSDPNANWSGSWWSAPVLAGLCATTRALPNAGPVRLRLVEDAMGWEAATSQRIRVPAGARIFEITGPRAWAELVARYPLDVSRSRRHDWWRTTARTGTWLIPDYLAVAAHFDAIHLTVAGYLTTAGRPSTSAPTRPACSPAGIPTKPTGSLIHPLPPGRPSDGSPQTECHPAGQPPIEKSYQASIRPRLTVTLVRKSRWGCCDVLRR